MITRFIILNKKIVNHSPDGNENPRRDCNGQRERDEEKQYSSASKNKKPDSY